jgi:hypothetical protein
MANTFTILLLFVIVNNLTAQTDKFSHQPDLVKLKTDSVLIKTEDEIVFTPAGPARKSNVHLIDKEHFLNIEKASIQIVNSKTGLVSQQFDTVLTDKIANAKAAFFSRIKTKSVSDTILENGYVAYAEFSNSIPISYFSTKYIVPSPPSTTTDQLVYLFNGLVWYEGGHILQPVLQWGKSPAGGGNFWAICNWYVIKNGQYFHDTPIEVSPGTNLQGVMKITSRSSDSLFNYSSSFAGYPGSMLQVNNIPQLNYAYEALEVYNINRGR